MDYTYYEILEISPFSAQHEVTQAYEKAKSTYSGENPAIYTMFSQSEARELLRMIEEAYSVLGNKSLRALYDEKIGHNQKSNISFESLKAEVLTREPQTKKVQHIKPVFEANSEMEGFMKSHAQWTGQDLKKVREYKNISLQAISETTKITAFYIQAIEQMETANLPAPVFVRGYVAQIAKNLGLDEKLVAESYMKAFKKS